MSVGKRLTGGWCRDLKTTYFGKCTSYGSRSFLKSTVPHSDRFDWKKRQRFRTTKTEDREVKQAERDGGEVVGTRIERT